MGKIKSFYENGIDKVWYNSSNVLYSECDDNVNQLKTLRLIFNNGRAYEYYDVDVNDYLLFRENISQGKAFNQYIKKYKCKKINDYNIENIEQELQKLLSVDNSSSKEQLFKKMESYYHNIIQIVNDFKKYNLNKNEYSYLLFLINKIMQCLTITNFSDNEINLLEIKDNLDNHVSLIQNEFNITSETELLNILKNKILK